VAADVGGYHGAYIHGTPNDSSPLEIPYEKVLVEYSPDPAAITAAIHEHASELACVLIEPVVMSRFAYLKSLAPTSYLQAVRDTCTACGVALIFDEVMTSRLAPGGAQELAGVTPDMMTCGKYFAGGLNFGAFGGTEAWMARHDPLHPETIASGGTFNQNAVSMAAAAAVLQHVWTPEICREHNAKGDLLRARINELAAAHNAPCDAHGTGSLINVVFRSLPLFEADGHTMTEDWKTEGLSSALVSSLFFFFVSARTQRSLPLRACHHCCAPSADRSRLTAIPCARVQMLEKGFLVGTPGLTYLTLPTALTDEDYDGFMVAFESFMIEMEEPLGLLDSLAQSSPMAMATMTHGHAGGGANERRLGRASL
jgi:glutamate-1-semialdehyde aminotransferase